MLSLAAVILMCPDVSLEIGFCLPKPCPATTLPAHDIPPSSGVYNTAAHATLCAPVKTGTKHDAGLLQHGHDRLLGAATRAELGC
jgi:hypothetical protein